MHWVCHCLRRTDVTPSRDSALLAVKKSRAVGGKQCRVGSMAALSSAASSGTRSSLCRGSRQTVGRLARLLFDHAHAAATCPARNRTRYVTAAIKHQNTISVQQP